MYSHGSCVWRASWITHTHTMCVSVFRNLWDYFIFNAAEIIDLLRPQERNYLHSSGRILEKNKNLPYELSVEQAQFYFEKVFFFSTKHQTNKSKVFFVLPFPVIMQHFWSFSVRPSSWWIFLREECAAVDHLPQTRSDPCIHLPSPTFCFFGAICNLWWYLDTSHPPDWVTQREWNQA